MSIELRSDNAAGAAPEILAALAEAAGGPAAPYGADEWTARLRRRVREVFEHDAAEVFPVVTGTAANALAISALIPPWGSVLCHENAHILSSEAAATSLLSGGALLRGLPGPGSKLTPAVVAEELATTRWGDPHASQPSALSVTCPTEYGAVYSPAEVAILAETARAHGLRVHLDGARLANALARLRCSAADLTWRAGVDVLSLGATKNGALTADAIVSFDPGASAELVYRIKRSGHVASKSRFQSAQLERYLTDGLWLELADRANRAAARLTAGLLRLGLEPLVPPEANLVFVRLTPEQADRLAAADVRCHRLPGGIVRLVTSFQTTAHEVDTVVGLLDTGR